MATGSAFVADSRDHIRARSIAPSIDEKKYYYYERVMRREQKAASSSWLVAAAVAACAVQLEMHFAFAERCSHLEWCAAVARCNASQLHARLIAVEAR